MYTQHSINFASDQVSGPKSICWNITGASWLFAGPKNLHTVVRVSFEAFQLAKDYCLPSCPRWRHLPEATAHNLFMLPAQKLQHQNVMRQRCCQNRTMSTKFRKFPTLPFVISSFLSVIGPDTNMSGRQLPSTAVVQVNQHRWNRKCYFKCVNVQKQILTQLFSSVGIPSAKKGKKQNVPTFLLLRLRWYIYIYKYHKCKYV